MAESLSDVFAKSEVATGINGAQSGIQAILNAPSANAVAEANLKGTAGIAEATVNLGNWEAGSLLANQASASAVWEKARAHQAMFGDAMNTVREQTQAEINNNIDLAQKSAIAAMDNERKLADIRDAKQKTWNPLKKLSLHFQEQDVASTVNTEATKASTYFQSASILADTTKSKMEQLISEDAMTAGLAIRLQEDAVKQQMAETATADKALSSVIGKTSTALSLLNNAAANKYSTQQQTEQFASARKLQNMQIADYSKRLKDEAYAQSLYKQITGITDDNAASIAVRGLTPEQYQLMARAASVIGTAQGEAAQTALMKGLTPGEVAKVGEVFHIKHFQNFGTDIYQDLVNTRIKDSEDTAYAMYKNGVKRGITLSKEDWVKANPKDATLRQKQAVDAVNATWNSSSAADLAPLVSRNATLPASYDITLSATPEAQVIAFRHVKPAMQALIKQGMAEGGALRTQYKMNLSENNQYLNMGENGPYIQGLALAQSLQQLYGMSEKDSFTAAADLLKSAGYASITDGSMTGNALRITKAANLEPELNVDINGIKVDVFTGVGLAYASKRIVLEAKRSKERSAIVKPVVDALKWPFTPNASVDKAYTPLLDPTISTEERALMLKTVGPKILKGTVDAATKSSSDNQKSSKIFGDGN